MTAAVAFTRDSSEDVTGSAPPLDRREGMTGWDRIRNDVCRRHRFAHVTAGEVRVVLGFDGTRVAIRVRPHGGAVIVLAELGYGQAFAPEDALRWNAGLEAGAIALIDEVYVVRAVVDELDGEVLEERLQAVAAAAATIKQRTARSIDPAVFANYAE